MGSGFLKFKRKVNTNALIKSLLLGISMGLVVFSVLFILYKREMIALQPLFSVLIGVGVAVIVSGGIYFCSKPKDEKLAKRLDKDLNLHEKVQTMLAFEGDDGAMKKLQRNDANAKLVEAPLSTVKFKGIWTYVAITLLSLATLISSFIIPAKFPAEEEDPPFDFTQWQKLRVENLIEYVERSDMLKNPKTYTIQQLENLIVALDEVETESVMKTYVVNVIVNVDARVDQVNSYATIRKSLGNTSETDLIKFANVLKELQYSASVTAFDNFREIFAYETFTETVEGFNGDVQTALLESGYDDSDTLYATIVAFLGDLEQLSNNWSSHTEISFDVALNGDSGIGGIFTNFAMEAHSALSEQKDNRRVSDYVINDLMDIFELSPEDIPDLGDEELDYQDKENDGGGEDEGAAPGGIGSGGTDYGSNDLIFDPEKGYILYGEVLNDYETIMDELLNDDSIPQEVKDKIRDYFNSL